ncbi:hypothetical protein FA95DRAFT_1612294 [Auriscalpium vulgare]|uniref:Uncharacterized protein n=1 Tax=Auriscalpium vulgare TaxID=40419 RepID=A0ACB8R6U9_9AGAM|nr:hypothetical protein FA95DRAFT_1612294 [Auriscalpium vulgare]
MAGNKRKEPATAGGSGPASKRARGATDEDGEAFNDTNPADDSVIHNPLGEERGQSPPWNDIQDEDEKTASTSAQASPPSPSSSRVNADSEADDLSFPAGAPAMLKQRVLSVLEYCDAPRDTYGVRHIPPSLQWSALLHNSKNRYLCRPGTKRAVTVWVPGVVTKLWLFDLSGNPHANAAVTVNPISARDMAGLRTLYTQYSSSSMPASNPDEVRASCWQSRSVRGRREQEVVPFDRLYDATRVLKAKTAMNRLPAEELHDGDTVLLEMTITRYAEKRADKQTSDKYRIWALYKSLQERFWVYQRFPSSLPQDGSVLTELPPEDHRFVIESLALFCLHADPKSFHARLIAAVSSSLGLAEAKSFLGFQAMNLTTHCEAFADLAMAATQDVDTLTDDVFHATLSSLYYTSAQAWASLYITADASSLQLALVLAVSECLIGAVRLDSVAALSCNTTCSPIGFVMGHVLGDKQMHVDFACYISRCLGSGREPELCRRIVLGAMHVEMYSVHDVLGHDHNAQEIAEGRLRLTAGTLLARLGVTSPLSSAQPATTPFSTCPSLEIPTTQVLRPDDNRSLVTNEQF